MLGPVAWIWYISLLSPKTLLRNQQPDRWASFAKRNSWAGSGTARFSYYDVPGYLFIERKVSHFDLDAHAEADAAAACCCCTWLWNWRIWHTSFILVTCKLRTESNIREITSDRFLSAFSSDSWIWVSIRLLRNNRQYQPRQKVGPRIEHRTYISFSINSRRLLTAMTASFLSCFNKTGPMSL